MEKEKQYMNESFNNIWLCASVDAEAGDYPPFQKEYLTEKNRLESNKHKECLKIHKQHNVANHYIRSFIMDCNLHVFGILGLYFVMFPLF